MNINSLSQDSRETYEKYCIKNKQAVDIDDVILSEENKKKLNEFLVERDNKKAFINVGFKPVNRILMYGASGTGKTYLTTAIANHYNLPLLQIDVSKFQTSSLPAILTSIFELANELNEAVIFLDECDTICWARDDKSNKTSSDIRMANNVLFQLLDGLSPDCVFVSATNMFENLDPAFVRRFNIRMKFLPPRITDFGSAIKKFINSNIFKYKEDMQEDVKRIVDYQVRNYERLSYYQIKDWVHRVEKEALINNTLEIKESDIYDLLMSEMRIAVKYDKDNQIYLHQYGVQSM